MYMRYFAHNYKYMTAITEIPRNMKKFAVDPAQTGCNE